MLINYLRSSSVGTLKFCEQQYYLNYCLGLENRAGPSATKGTIFHLVFELRALAGIAHRAGKKTIDHDVFGKKPISWAKDYKKTLPVVYEYVKKKDDHIDFDSKISQSQIEKWCKATLEKWPEYDPFTMNVVYAEYHFDFKIEKPWAKYSVMLDGKLHEDYLRIVGTIDNVIDLGDNIYQVYDYKSGAKREDFVTGEEKDSEYLKRDAQMLFYYYACKTVWPDKDFVMSLAFVNAGGIFSVIGDEEMYEAAERMIEKSFKQVLGMKRPQIFDQNHYDWRCKYCCEFSKPANYTGGKSVCQYFADKIRMDGIEKTTAENIDLRKLGEYQDGGGRTTENRSTAN